jgi:hypothetical protein
MRALVALAAVALLTAPSYAQETPGGRKHHGGEQKTDQKSKKPDDKAYNAAISRIPTQKYDPWQNIRTQP